ncbi:MAG TPA: YraN family protein [Noviherbaspirillum sp.]|uniref:YraN family protein n=1 Tax=Noviherbaspirillum sp. TaxID=1926288 RepID=UPI002B46D47F|nr:YraN family protein [Noviherbaspirillum sp.]HJV87170.1 YraN family protein [Noviherbaspirillum sp.]
MGVLDAFRRSRTAKQVAGDAAEDRALHFLEQQGMTPIARNFRCKGGEIDLVMRHRDTLVFVEVRKRGTARFGGAAASVTARKQARLVIAAQVFLQRYKIPPPCRFDVIAIEGERINWLQNAIEAGT